MTTISLGQEVLKFDEFGNPYYVKTINKRSETANIQPQECTLPLMKELTIKIILKRDFYSPQGEPKKWFGLQTIKIAIPKEKPLRYYFLAYDPKCMSNVCVKVVSPEMYDSFNNYNSVAWDMSLSATRDSIEYEWIKRIGKPQTITALKAKTLLDSKEAFCIMTDQGELAT